MYSAAMYIVPAKPNTKCLSAGMQLLVINILWLQPPFFYAPEKSEPVPVPTVYIFSYMYDSAQGKKQGVKNVCPGTNSLIYSEKKTHFSLTHYCISKR